MAKLETPSCEKGWLAADFSLKGVDERLWTLQDCMGQNGLLIMFICNHCPYVKAIKERLVRDTEELLGYGVNSVAIMPNDVESYPEDSFEHMKTFAEQCSFSFPYLIDETQAVAKKYGAVCTPDFFGFNRSLQLQYRGRLDESGMQPCHENSKRELFDAMVRIAQTGIGPERQIPSIGCSIKWK